MTATPSPAGPRQAPPGPVSPAQPAGSGPGPVSAPGRARPLLWLCYYLAILAAVLWIVAHGDFQPPQFIYQGF